MNVFILKLKYNDEPEMIGMVADSHEKAEQTGKEWQAECVRGFEYRRSHFGYTNADAPETSFRIVELLLNEPTF